MSQRFIRISLDFHENYVNVLTDTKVPLQKYCGAQFQQREILQMKKVLFALLAVTLLCGLSFAADGAGPKGMSARSASVTLKAIVPEYLALNVVNAEPVMFDFKGQEEKASSGYTNFFASASTLPSWTLNYNLKNRIVTVCAYASDLMGTSALSQGNNAKIPAASLSAQSLQNNLPWAANFDHVATECPSRGANSILLDTIGKATSSHNTFGGPRVEGFSMFQLNGNSGGPVPAPDTYRGHLYIVAQAI